MRAKKAGLYEISQELPPHGAVLFSKGMPGKRQTGRSAMIDTAEVRIEVPDFDVPLILASNAALWMVIVGIAAMVS